MRRIKSEISQEWSHETNTRISQRTNPAALKEKSLQIDSSQGGWRVVVKKKKGINVDFLNNAMQLVTHKFEKKK